MIVLPRSITSPSVTPSRGTGSAVSGSATLRPASVGIGTPCRAMRRARDSRSQRRPVVLRHAQSVAGPYDSVSPYRCVTRNPIVSIASITADGGAAPPVATSTVCANASFADAGAWISMLSTIGAPHRWVTRWSRDRREDQRRIDAPQADVRTAHGRHRPRVGPAAAMEHRQRPQVHAVGTEPERERVAERVEVCAAVVVDDAFRIAGRAGRVEQRERVPFIARTRPGERGIAFREQRLVSERAEPLVASPCPGPSASSRSTTTGDRLHNAQRLPHHRREFGVGRAALSPRHVRGRTASVRASSRTFSGFSTAPSAGTA